MSQRDKIFIETMKTTEFKSQRDEIIDNRISYDEI